MAEDRVGQVVVDSLEAVPSDARSGQVVVDAMTLMPTLKRVGQVVVDAMQRGGSAYLVKDTIFCRGVRPTDGGVHTLTFTYQYRRSMLSSTDVRTGQVAVDVMYLV